MTTLEDALRFDAQDQPMAAIKAYEKLISDSQADVEKVLNLAVLYFQCWDDGYAFHHKLSQEYSAKALQRAIELIDFAESKFGKTTETQFWKLYFEWAALGGPPFSDRCRSLLKKEFSLIPFFYLCSTDSSDKATYSVQAKQLYETVKAGETAKNRYIRSILESALHLGPEKYRR